MQKLAKTSKIRKAAKPYVLLLPVSILLVFFFIGLLSGIAQSFGFAPFLGNYTFTLDYYVQAMGQYQLAESVFYSLYLAAACTIASTLGAIILSAALVRLKVGNTLKLFSLYVPLSVAHTVVVLLVVVIFGSSGLFARFLYSIGVIENAQTLPSVIGAFSGWGIILVFMYKEIPYITLCTISLMSNINSTLAEAASCLGSSHIKTFFNITLPLCKKPIIRAALVVFAFAFGSYEIPYLLGTSNPKSIAVMAFYEFQNRSIVDRSYAMTLVTLMIVITLIIAVIYFVLLDTDKKKTR
jgi:putative spermidine/putrescine transport system permease protein